MNHKIASGKPESPRANEIDGNFFPRLSNIIARRQVALTTARELVALALVAGGDMISDASLGIGKPEMG